VSSNGSQFIATLQRLSWGVRRAVLAAASWLWPLMRLIVRRILEVIFALVLLFEEWGWRPLAAWIGKLARFPVIAKIETVISALPPYGALFAFLLPSIFLFPLKLLAIYLIATGHALMAALLFIGAKVAGTAVVARLFMITQPKLMQIGWFARLYNWLMPWKDRAFAAIRVSWAWRYGRIVKHKLGQAVRARWQSIRPQLMAARDRLVGQIKVWLGR
jgi:hypothetical protein